MATYSTNKERVNFSRICRVIVDLSADVLRRILSSIANPFDIKNILRCCSEPDRRSAGIMPSQWKCINNATTAGSYKEFDISLLYTLLRLLSIQDLRDTLSANVLPQNIHTKIQNCPALITDPRSKLSPDELNAVRNAATCGTYDDCKDALLWKLYIHLCPSPYLNNHPTLPWGENNMPGSSHKTIGDDVERIRLIRNIVYAHISTTEMSDNDFNYHWSCLEDITTRIDQHFPGLHYRSRLDSIKVVCMDDASDKFYHEEIAKLADEEKTIQNDIKEITEEMKNVKVELRDRNEYIQAQIEFIKDAVSKAENKLHAEIEASALVMEEKVKESKMENNASKEAIKDLNTKLQDVKEETHKSLAMVEQNMLQEVEKKVDSALCTTSLTDTESKMKQAVQEELNIKTATRIAKMNEVIRVWFIRRCLSNYFQALACTGSITIINPTNPMAADESDVNYDSIQWVSKVNSYSSQYDSMLWPASCLIGPPKVYPNYGDIPGAWAQGIRDQNQFVEIQFDQSVFIRKVEIYETFHGGAVSCVKVRAPDGSWESLWHARPDELADIKHSRKFAPPIKLVGYQANELRIELTCLTSGTWCEIDAIRIFGNRTNDDDGNYESKQWVSKVISYSSQFDDIRWSANCLLGQPKVYPNYGDIPGAWAQGILDRHQYVEVQFDEKIFIEKIKVFETFHGGAVSCIKVRAPDKSWDTLWTEEPEDLDDIKSSRIFSPPIKSVGYQANELRLEINCEISRSWCEIDAIQIWGNRFYRELCTANGSAIYDVKQWVSKVAGYSSQYDHVYWSANCIIGKPKVYPKYGDIPGAWSQGAGDKNQYVEVKFDEAVYIQEVAIYETFHGGAVSCVKVRAPDASWDILWAAGPDDYCDIEHSRKFSPPIKVVDYPSNELRIELNCGIGGPWHEIDAIKILGNRRID